EDHQWAEDLVREIGEAPILINRVAGPRTDKKNWPNEYWEKLVPELLKIAPVVEIGTQYPSPLQKEECHPISLYHCLGGCLVSDNLGT
ncbi:MAG: hypothetical protein LPK47_04795, partial [Bacteroidota bacterium]|nr:hypothetical protein [Bacteroidota bacterium]